ncbi:MAG: DUF1615 family protein, partial [Proteobacteria bacterium]
FQNLLSQYTGTKLVEDGDLLAYDKDGDPTDLETNSLKALLLFAEKNNFSAWTAKRDARKEKSIDFEETTSWQELRKWAETGKGKVPTYAKVPNVKLDSPKLRSTLSTDWFANSVKKHYQACRSR